MGLEHESERQTLEAKRERRGAPEGRAADFPTELRYTKMATIKRTLREFSADELNDRAASLTYYGVLALFPGLIALLSIVGLVGSSVTDELLSNIRSISPGPARDILESTVQNVAGSRGQAGVAFVIGLLLALNSASGYVAAFTRASNAIYEVEEGRPVWKLKPQQIGIVLVGVLALVLVTSAVVVTGPVAEEVGKVVGVDGGTTVVIWDIAKIPVVLGVVSLLFAFLYKAAPNVKQPGFPFFSPGGVVALAIWLLASALFALYLGTFASYSKTYGSLGGVVAFLVWFWITNLAILFGAEFNAELQRSQQIEAGEPMRLDEPFLEPRDVSKLEKKAKKDQGEGEADGRPEGGTPDGEPDRDRGPEDAAGAGEDEGGREDAGDRGTTDAPGADVAGAPSRGGPTGYRRATPTPAEGGARPATSPDSVARGAVGTQPASPERRAGGVLAPVAAAGAALLWWRRRR